jgi:hypothetical protein
MTGDQARGAMTAFQEITGAFLDMSDWIGAPGEDQSFVKRSGWRKIANAYSVSTEIIGQSIDRDASGEPIRAHATVRATNRVGRFADGDGGCGVNEPRFRNPTGRQKIEHDLPATAVTRATNRAISNLVGFGQVSAEEVDADVRAGSDASAGALPAWAEYGAEGPLGPVANAASQLVAIVELAGADPAGVPRAGAAIREHCGGGIPECVVYAIGTIHAALGSADASPNGEEE